MSSGGCNRPSDEAPDGGVESDPFVPAYHWPRAPISAGEEIDWTQPDGPRPPSTLPFAVADTADWGASRDPFCDEQWGWVRGDALLAAEGAIHLAVGTEHLGATPYHNSPIRASVYRNRGSGWETLFTHESWHPSDWPEFAHLGGSPSTGLLWGQADDCDVGRFHDDETSCAFRVPDADPRVDLHGIVAEGAEIAVLMSDGVYRFDGTRWSRESELEPERFGHLAGRPNEYVVARANSEVFVVEEGVRRDLSPVPLGEYSALAIEPSTGVVWLATFASDSLFWHDGVSWQLVPITSSPCAAGDDPILDLWLGPSRTYFIRQTTLSYVENGMTTDVVSYDCSDATRTRFRQVEGLADDEVFVLMQDTELSDHECGESIMLWYDGDDFHYL